MTLDHTNPHLTDKDAIPLWNKTFDAVLFDNDGTLSDSTGSVERSWRQWAIEYGVPGEQLTGFHGVPALDIIRAVLPGGDHQVALARITELEAADVADVVALPGAVTAVTTLGGRCAVVTSATRPLAEVRLAAAGIPDSAAVVTIDDVERGKPAPDPFLAGARRLGVDPGRCLVVEDAPSGLAAGRAAGCSTLAVVTTTPRSDLLADAVVGTLADVRFTIDDTGLIRVAPHIS